MLNFDEYLYFLRKSTNFATADNFDQLWVIIEETLQLDKHKMLMGNACQFWIDQSEFELLEKVDLIDFWELEKSYGGNQKR